MRNRLLLKGAVVGTAVAVVCALSLTLAFETQTPVKPKRLSMTNVTIAAGPNAVSGPLFIALQSGLFKNQGLNARWLSTPGGSSSVVASILGGAATFVDTGAAAEVQAAASGAPLRAILEGGVGDPQQIAITKRAALAHHIPSANETNAKALTQFMALKGSHLSIATSTLTSNSYQWFIALARKVGITYTLNNANPKADVNVVTLGSPAQEVAGFLSGKVEGFMNIPPATVQPNSIVIPYGYLEPLNNVVANYLVTTTTMIDTHPDTVQAVTTAMTEATQPWRLQHPTKARSMVNSVVAANSPGTPPSILNYVYNQNSKSWSNPFPRADHFNQTLAVYNLSLATPLKTTYKGFVDSKFAQKANQLLHLDQ